LVIELLLHLPSHLPSL
jgi:hypothetical protein